MLTTLLVCIAYSSFSSLHAALISCDSTDPCIGTDDNDKIGGNGESNIMLGLEGNDEMTSGGGNDGLAGGDGNDQMDGGGGFDAIIGDEGNDKMNGMDGTDFMQGGDGNDEVYGGDGNDEMEGGYGGDTFICGSGHDKINDFSTGEGDTKSDDCEDFWKIFFAKRNGQTKEVKSAAVLWINLIFQYVLSFY